MELLFALVLPIVVMIGLLLLFMRWRPVAPIVGVGVLAYSIYQYWDSEPFLVALAITMAALGVLILVRRGWSWIGWWILAASASGMLLMAAAEGNMARTVTFLLSLAGMLLMWVVVGKFLPRNKKIGITIMVASAIAFLWLNLR